MVHLFRIGGTMQVGDLVKTKAFGGLGIVLQIAPHPSNLIQIKWFDDAHYVDINDPRSYWYHPSNLETLAKPLKKTLSFYLTNLLNRLHY
mgnify:CR=1 FL=1